METILVLDDEAASLKLMIEILSSGGYRVRPADSGVLALASISAEPPDLILADVRMPGMDGFEFCRRLKTHRSGAGIPLIFLSALTDAGACVEGLKLGAVDFISKPFHCDELLARVRTHLELGRLRGNLETQVARRTAELRDAIVQLQCENADRARAEEALRESDERFRDIANSAPVHIWTSGPDKRYTFFNTARLRFTGRAIEQEIGDGWSVRVHPDDLDRCLSTYSSAFDARHAFKMEYRLLRADGEYRWMLDEGTPRFQPGGRFLGYTGSCIDITDVRRVQEEALGRERVESLRLLAGGIAHDLTNLMSTILATAELAETEVDERSSCVEEIQTIKTIASGAVEMARGLMIYAGQDKGNLELLDLSQIAEETAKLLKTSISKNSVLKSDFSKDLSPVWGNPTHIRQIVMNLLINAAEAVGEQGGSIRIRTSRVPDGSGCTKHARFSPDREYLRLEVSDSGCGMTEEQQTRIFDPFFTTKGTGHGWGLAVVQGVVHSHGGVINVASTPGQGTTFEIFLPCAHAHSMSGAHLVTCA